MPLAPLRPPPDRRPGGGPPLGAPVAARPAGAASGSGGGQRGEGGRGWRLPPPPPLSSPPLRARRGGPGKPVLRGAGGCRGMQYSAAPHPASCTHPPPAGSQPTLPTPAPRGAAGRPCPSLPCETPPRCKGTPGMGEGGEHTPCHPWDGEGRLGLVASHHPGGGWVPSPSPLRRGCSLPPGPSATATRGITALPAAPRTQAGPSCSPYAWLQVAGGPLCPPGGGESSTA